MRSDPRAAPVLLLRAALLIAALAAVSATACGGAGGSSSTPTPRPLPSPVAFRQEPQGVTLGDPAFQPLPGARADYGRLGGSVYQIEMPGHWNGRLVLFMHGSNFQAPGSVANVSAPDFRTYLVLNRYAWGASSFSSTSFIPGRAADETAALWDFFAKKYGRPSHSYITGFSMGGAATNIAAERHVDRFDGALAQCGAAGANEGSMWYADYFAAGAYLAGVTQADYDASTNPGALIHDRILPALLDPAKELRFQNMMIDLTGGPRAFDREGFRIEEQTNWARVELVVRAGLAANAGKDYQLGPLSDVPSDEFNRAAVRLRTNDQLIADVMSGNETTGNLQMPLLSMYSTGDGQVPIFQSRILQQRVDAAGKSRLLVQRIFRDPSHCGFTTAEQEASFEALVRWVEHGEKPAGEDVLVKDLQTLGGKFELSPRPGTAEAGKVQGAGERGVVSGNLTLGGTPLDAQYLGAVVRKDGLVTPCQLTLVPADRGRYEITVMADAESSGCGARGGDIVLWAFAQNQRLWTRESVPWPADSKTAAFDATFSLSTPAGAMSSTSDFIGEIFTRPGRRLPPGTRVEAFVGDVRCGVASTRRTGNYSGYVLSVAGPESIPGCTSGATLTFRADGRQAEQTATNTPGGHGATLDLIVP